MDKSVMTSVSGFLIDLFILLKMRRGLKLAYEGVRDDTATPAFEISKSVFALTDFKTLRS
jgi:hypothetical protein